MVLGRRTAMRDIDPGGIRIACAIHVPADQMELPRAARALAKRSRRRPMTQEELGELLKELSPDRLYEGPDSVREALHSDVELKEAVSRLALILETARAAKKGVRTPRPRHSGGSTRKRPSRSSSIATQASTMPSPSSPSSASPD